MLLAKYIQLPIKTRNNASTKTYNEAILSIDTANGCAEEKASVISCGLKMPTK